MKSIIILFLLFLVIISCKSNEISPADIVGKWKSISQILEHDINGNYVLQPISIIEFTSDRQFLNNGRLGAGCCYAGNKYTLSENKIIFIEQSDNGCTKGVATDCDPCTKFWVVDKMEGDTLIFTMCSTKRKYVKVK